MTLKENIPYDEIRNSKLTKVKPQQLPCSTS